MDAKKGPPNHPQPVLPQPALHSLSPLYSLVDVVLSEGCVRHWNKREKNEDARYSVMSTQKEGDLHN